MKEALVHTICAKCDKSVALFVTPEEYKAMKEGTKCQIYQILLW